MEKYTSDWMRPRNRLYDTILHQFLHRNRERIANVQSQEEMDQIGAEFQGIFDDVTSEDKLPNHRRKRALITLGFLPSKEQQSPVVDDTVCHEEYTNHDQLYRMGSPNSTERAALVNTVVDNWVRLGEEALASHPSNQAAIEHFISDKYLAAIETELMESPPCEVCGAIPAYYITTILGGANLGTRMLCQDCFEEDR